MHDSILILNLVARRTDPPPYSPHPSPSRLCVRAYVVVLLEAMTSRTVRESAKAAYQGLIAIGSICCGTCAHAFDNMAALGMAGAASGESSRSLIPPSPSACQALAAAGR